MSSTSFAVLAKARAKFGKRLTEKDYNSLLNSNSVAEVMSYLKSYTHYAEALRDINERDVHRGRLEVPVYLTFLVYFSLKYTNLW